MTRAKQPRRGFIGPFSARQVVLAVASVAVSAVVIVIVTSPLGSIGPGDLPNPVGTAFVVGSEKPGLAVGASAPEFAVADGAPLTDLDGRPVRLADLRGKAVWVNFWASWCPPCQSETPVLREVERRYRDRGLVLVAVDVQETVDDALRYATKYGLKYLIGADVSGDVFRQYRVFALPTQFFIDATGVIRKVVNGPLSVEGASAAIEAILPAPSRGASQ